MGQLVRGLTFLNVPFVTYAAIERVQIGQPTKS
jgi:hypothetical protein